MNIRENNNYLKLQYPDCITLSLEHDDLEGEKWSHVSYLPPSIEVSNLGRIRKYYNLTEYNIVNQRMNNDYLQFCYNNNYYISHRVIAETFLADSMTSSKRVVNHKNGIKYDNRVENLEWISPQENLVKSYNWGTDGRKKLYCEDLDKVFGTLRSASYILNIPQDILSNSIKENYPIFGHTLRYIEADDPILRSHTIFYLDFENAINLIRESSDLDDFNKRIAEYLGDGLVRYKMP